MPSHYWMVLVNVILLCSILIGIIVYKRFFPKKEINYLFLLGLFSLLPVVSIFRFGSYESGDFVQHVYRAFVFYDILREGILIPSWAPLLNSGFGYPVFIFIYPLPYYLISFFHMFGFSFIFSAKLVLVAAYIASGFLMYAVLKKMTKNSFAAFSGALVYLFTPYHLVDLHFRVAMAELIAFAIAPALFYVILKIEEVKTIIYILLAGLLWGLFFLAHPAQFLFYSGIFFAYVGYKQFRNKKLDWQYIISITIAFVIGLMVSSFSWIARFTLTQYTQGSLLTDIPVSYVRPWELLFSPYRYGFLFQGSHGELSFLIGYTQIIILGIGILLLIREWKRKKFSELPFWISLSLVLIFCMLPYSKILWEAIPMLNLMQFSYRLLHPLSFCLSIITALIIVSANLKKPAVLMLIFITVAYTILNWGHRHMLPNVNDSTLRNMIMYTKEEGMIEANPIWWDRKKINWIDEVPKNHIEVIKGKAEVKEIQRTSTKHTYIYYSSQPATLVENTFYFPNWTITIDNKPVKISYETTEHRARMVFEAPKGLHTIEVTYKDIPQLHYAKLLSLLTVSGILLFFIISLIRSFIKRQVKGKRKQK